MSSSFCMIVTDPDSATSSHHAALNVRELRAFLSRAKAAARLRGEVSVLLATDATVRALNRDYRGKNKATDVLSFPVDAEHPSAAKKQAGDLAISLDTAHKQAAQHGHDLQTEVKILMLHGVLHLAGYDHETDNGEMAEKESALRKQLDLPVGLIQRSEKQVGKTAAKKTGSRA
ncbi:MAG TPA: rRNA maturation RNase YbeY [Alloacidobacterium sp.]|nr:rRNA maturation RNase YbeY [Alloacidobacterium sp.]